MQTTGKVILGVAASDAHVVANHLIAYQLRAQGYEVINLGACTPVEEFASAGRAHPDAIAMLIGSLNGHAYEDLKELKSAKHSGAIGCPVIVGGNLSVGSEKKESDVTRLYGIGVDHVLSYPSEILPLLRELQDTRTMNRPALQRAS